MKKERPTLLIVDDEPLLRRTVLRLVGRMGIAVIDAATGAEALRIAAEQPPTAILLDLTLADGSGLAVLAQLRAIPGTRDVPVLVYSGSTSEAVRRTALALGADYLAKPFEPEVFLARIRELVANPTSGVVRRDRLDEGE